MVTKTSLLLGASAMVLAGAGLLAWRFAFFVAPFRWTGEPARLAKVLKIEAGMRVADIGAGTGALALALAEGLGPSCEILATELSPARLDALSRLNAGPGGRPLTVVAATATDTGLPDDCCDAVYMRAMLHHVSEPEQFAAAVRRAVRSGGRVAVIDFPPGGLPFHGADHGITPERVVGAFTSSGLTLRERIDDWGGGMFLLLFEEG